MQPDRVPVTLLFSMRKMRDNGIVPGGGKTSSPFCPIPDYCPIPSLPGVVSLS
jgi:hypothetical protein